MNMLPPMYFLTILNLLEKVELDTFREAHGGKIVILAEDAEIILACPDKKVLRKIVKYLNTLDCYEQEQIDINNIELF